VLNLTLRPQTMERVKAAGVRANPRVTLAPGRYQVRIGAREDPSGRLGSVFYDLQVPDFSKDPLMLSGVLLTAPSSEQTPTAQPDPTNAKLMPGAATSRRDGWPSRWPSFSRNRARRPSSRPNRPARRAHWAVRPGRLPGLRVAAAGAVHRGRHRCLEHEPASARIERVVLGRTGLPRPPAFERKRRAVGSVARDRRAAVCHRPAAKPPAAARGDLVSGESNLHFHSITVRPADGFALARGNPRSNATLIVALDGSAHGSALG